MQSRIGSFEPHVKKIQTRRRYSINTVRSRVKRFAVYAVIIYLSVDIWIVPAKRPDVRSRAGLHLLSTSECVCVYDVWATIKACSESSDGHVDRTSTWILNFLFGVRNSHVYNSDVFTNADGNTAAAGKRNPTR